MKKSFVTGSGRRVLTRKKKRARENGDGEEARVCVLFRKEKKLCGAPAVALERKKKKKRRGLAIREGRRGKSK
jgi:hypothetical protein